MIKPKQVDSVFSTKVRIKYSENTKQTYVLLFEALHHFPTEITSLCFDYWDLELKLQTLLLESPLHWEYSLVHPLLWRRLERASLKILKDSSALLHLDMEDAILKILTEWKMKHFLSLDLKKQKKWMKCRDVFNPPLKWFEGNAPITEWLKERKKKRRAIATRRLDEKDLQDAAFCIWRATPPLYSMESTETHYLNDEQHFCFTFRQDLVKFILSLSPSDCLEVMDRFEDRNLIQGYKVSGWRRPSDEVLQAGQSNMTNMIEDVRHHYSAFFKRRQKWWMLSKSE